MRSRISSLSAGLALGIVLGVTAWGGKVARSRNALFHVQPVRRLAAISYLRARPSVDSVRLLRDYISWETHPLLRRRGLRALRSVERALN